MSGGWSCMKEKRLTSLNGIFTLYEMHMIINFVSLFCYREGNSTKPSGICKKQSNSGVMSPRFSWTKNATYSETKTYGDRKVDIFTGWVSIMPWICHLYIFNNSLILLRIMLV